MTLDTSEKDLKSLFQNGFLDLKIADNIDDHGLIQMLEEHSDKEYSFDLFEIITQHKNTTAKVIDAIVSKMDNGLDLSLINSIITSGKTSRKTLDLFKKIQSNSIQEHLELAYLKDDLKKLESVSEFKKLVDLFSDDDNPTNHAKRFLIASSTETPVEVLDLLLNDNHRHVVDAAMTNLLNRKDEGSPKR